MAGHVLLLLDDVLSFVSMNKFCTMKLNGVVSVVTVRRLDKVVNALVCL